MHPLQHFLGRWTQIRLNVTHARHYITTDSGLHVFHSAIFVLIFLESAVNYAFEGIKLFCIIQRLPSSFFDI